jgi:hypothetical protein
MDRNEIIKRAAEMVAEFEKDTAGMTEGGYEYDSTLSYCEADAWRFVQEIAALKGVVTRNDDIPKVEFHRERLAENQLPALAWFIRRSFQGK